LILLLVTFLFLCCDNSENRPTPTIKNEYYPNGAIKSEVTYMHDTIKNGRYIYYYSNGAIYREGFFINGKMDSIVTGYYSNGKVYMTGMYSYGILLGSVYYYYDNGRLKTYNSRDNKGDAFYVIRFDSFGRKIYEEGINISRVGMDLNKKDSFYTNDTLHFVWIIAEPPGYENNIQIGIKIMDIVNKQYHFVEPFKYYHVNRSIIDFKKVFNYPGNYQIFKASKLTNVLSGKYILDTTYLEVNVK
jgi:hypothetical protein